MVNIEDNFGPLCEDVLVNILRGLPERDLLRCKCVSKQWNKIVSYVCIPLVSAHAPVCGVYFRMVKGDEVPLVTASSPQEVIDQLHHQVAYRDYVHCIATSSLDPVTPLDHSSIGVACPAQMSLESILPFDHGGPDFLDCCNGLVLFVRRPKPQFFVCNPVIRQCVHIPLPPPSIHLSCLYASLAFDPVESMEYRVVMCSLSTQPQCMHVFSSVTGEWKTHEIQIELSTAAKSFKLVRYSVYLKNVVYRLSLFLKILCFDLNSMEVLVLDCPSQKPPPSNPTYKKDQPPPGCIGVSKGCLSYVTDEDGHVCVWLLDKPNEWSLKHKICSQYLWKSASKQTSLYFCLLWLRSCGLHPTSDIVFLSSARSVFMYHIGSGRLEKIRYLDSRFETNGGFFFPIFLHKNIYVTLKNWSKGFTKIDSYEDIQDRWCYIEQ